jgi:predicted DNA-binding transcriptional regulator YafY
LVEGKPPELAFEPNELRAPVEGARPVSNAGGDAVTEDAESALRKLAFDLDVPVGSALGETQAAVLAPREPATAGKIRVLGEALLRLKCVLFDYRSMSSDITTVRTVESYGLLFLRAHWYLAARAIANGEIRNFRASRMDETHLNKKKPQSVDFEMFQVFRLADYARQRGPWELGDGDAEQCS